MTEAVSVEARSPIRDAAADWEAFAASRTAEARCNAWLTLLCARLPEVRAGAVLIENPKDHSYLPMAVWPKAGPELSRLSAVVESLLKEHEVVVKTLPDDLLHLAYPLNIDDRIAGVVALESLISGRDPAALIHEIHWSAAWLINLLADRERIEAIQARERLGSVLETVAAALRHGQKLQQALFELTNALRLSLNCSRVALGLAEHSTIRLAALSDAATFDKRMSLVKSYQRAMDEARDAQHVVQSPPGETDAESSQSHTAPMHDALRALSGSGAVLSWPLKVGVRCIGVITLERENAPFTEPDRVWLEAFSVLASPVIEQRRAAERNALRRLGDDISSVLEKLFGPRHLTWKLGAITAMGAVAVLTLTPIDYRVSAKTLVEGEVQRVVAAPFDGFIGEATARAGDTVTAGQPLAWLDDRELRIEEARWASEQDQYENRVREATANHDLTAMEVVGAQLRQASAQLALVKEKIARAKLIAPFDGVVVSGDLSQQIGAPVEMGKTLFEIAPLLSYRVILQVDEREIRHVRVGQSGALVMTGIAGEPMPFKVASVTPVATARDGQNFFRVEAALSEASPRLRPGMEGVGKIEAGRRSLWWVLTHGFADWLSLWFWTWMP
jgi:hypothetical protein